MCGIAGFTGNGPVDVNALRILMLDNEVRGPHSVGVFGKHLYRSLGPPKDNVGSEDFYNAADGAWEVIAHNRFATTGKVTKENAHPFKIGNGKNTLYGTHNGFIPDELYDKVCKEFGIAKPDVDSQAIYQILYENAMDFDVLGKIDAMMALAFIWDSKLYLYRRSTRPIWLGELANNKIYYSSREEGLAQIGVRYLHSLEPHRMHVFKSGQLLDSFAVRQPRLYYLGDECMPQNWELKVKDSDKKFYPEVFAPKKWNWRNQTWERQVNNGTTNGESLLPAITRTNGPTSERKDGSPSNQTELMTEQAEIEDTFQYLEADLMEHSNDIELPSTPGFYKFFDVGDSETAQYVLCLKDNIHEAPLGNWVVGFKGVPGTYAITTSNGMVVIQIPRSVFRVEGSAVLRDSISLRLIVVDPFNYKKFYTKEITVVKSRVVEGTLLVPFRPEETPQGKINFCDVEDNLLTRAIFSREIANRFGVKNTAKTVHDAKGGEVSSTTGQSGDAKGDDEKSVSELICRAVGVQLLLSASYGPEMGRKQINVVDKIDPSGGKDNQKNSADESKSHTDNAQGVQVLDSPKETEYSFKGGPGSTHSCECVQHKLLVETTETERARKFYAEMSDMLKEEQKQKKATMKPLVDGFLSDMEKEFNVNYIPADDRVAAEESAKMPKRKEFVFLESDREEDHIRELVDVFSELENYTMNKLVEPLQQIASGIGNDPYEIQRQLSSIMADAIFLSGRIADNLEKYKRLTTKDGFLPF